MIADSDCYTHDLVVVGAGPAGMAAALTAAEHGSRVALLDEQPRPGGQIYRHITRVKKEVLSNLGADYQYGKNLTERLRYAAIDIHFDSLVWNIDKNLEIFYVKNSAAFKLKAKQIILATGAMERPSPIPGWTLPGVLNAGAAQILLKQTGCVPDGKVFLIGSGPLLYLIACQLIDAGADLAGIIDTSGFNNLLEAIPQLFKALSAPGYLLKGAKMLMKIKNSGVAIYRDVKNIRMEGDEVVRRVSFDLNGVNHSVDVNTVLLHHGVIPNTQFSRLIGAKHHWSDLQNSWQPVLDEKYKSSIDGIRIVGDGSAIAGALAAELSGSIAAMYYLLDAGKVTKKDGSIIIKQLKIDLKKQMAIRSFLDVLYRPPEWLFNPPDDTIICRCEEITAGEIRKVTELGCIGPNQLKFFCRCGMGPCQGRQCSTAVTQIMATTLNMGMDEVGNYRLRPPLKPMPLESFASLRNI